MRRRKRTLDRIVNRMDGVLDEYVHESRGRNPLVAFDSAIGERKASYRDLREAAAGVMFLRNKLDAEQIERRVKLARVFEGVRRAVRENDDDTSLALLTYRHLLRDEVERAEEELAGLRTQVHDAKQNLALLSAEIRDLERERLRARATLMHARVRRRQRRGRSSGVG